MTTQNLILNTDSYKLTHYLQYPPGTTRISSYIESRGGALGKVLFFGLQAFLKEYLARPISRADIDEAEEVCRAHLGVFNRQGWEHIVERHGGYLPIEIQALPEGTLVGSHVPVAQVINTDPACFWVPSYIETALLRAVWYPSTVASLSMACKVVLRQYLEETADNLDALPFQLHDFGARGATSDEAAGLGGAGHLLNFQGTDTMAALMVARRSYGEAMAGFSIPASEHSTMTSWGKAGEAAAYRNMIRQFAGPQKVLAFVIDSYDVWNALDHIVGEELHGEVVANGGRIVVRPDSGDPVAVVPRVIEHLMRRFGHTQNSKGYRVLPPYIRMIQGDGVDLNSLPRILEVLKMHAISTENLAFGMGGGLLQKVDRDTLKWAMKASWGEIDGQPREIFKDPVTDPGKRSKAGRYGVIRVGDGYEAVREEALGGRRNLLRPVWRDGRLLAEDSFARIRARAAEHFEIAYRDTLEAAQRSQAV
ncbi:MAG: nicotinate phosphoribosyltransferase [Nevskia sp.]|nr:nicotinate phosphoribosyltransferase [Nevskia sp.]